MSGWLRYFALNAQSRTGLSAAVLTAAIIAAVAAVGAAVFLLVALFIWLADIYDGVIAGVVLGGAFALIALIALIACLMIRRGNLDEQERRDAECRNRPIHCVPPISPDLRAASNV